MIVCIGRLRGAMQLDAPLNPEAETAVVQHHAGLLRQDAAAERLEQRVDEAACVAVLVDDAQIDGVAVRRQDQLARCRQVTHRRDIGDQRPLRREIVRAEKFLHRNVDRTRIGNERVAVAVCQPRRLDMPVSADGSGRPVRCRGQTTSIPRIINTSSPWPFGGH